MKRLKQIRCFLFGGHEWIRKWSYWAIGPDPEVWEECKHCGAQREL